MSGRRAPLAVLALTMALWAGGPSGLAAQEGEWWTEIDRMASGFHAIEVDSVYEISGFTHEDILREMEHKGPRADAIGPRLGLHLSQWRYSYRYSGGGGSGRCRLTEAQVLLRSVIVLPEWTNASTAPPHVAEGWRPFMEALRRHEDGHRSRAKAQGAMLWTALLGLEAPRCDQLEARVRAAAEQVLADGESAQEAYDRETGHGAAQGATWPRRGS